MRIPEIGDHFVLVGLSYTDWQIDRVKLIRLMGELPSGDFTVLLYHKPDLAYAARDAGVNVYLAGHTHGGQVRLPLIGALFTGSLYGKIFEAGRMQLGSMVLYISRGIGLEGAAAPRVRFLCPPEIILWELTAG